jgi:alpha-tubulin suppressor-like RCC1 family protein
MMNKANLRTVTDNNNTTEAFQRVACGQRHTIGLSTDGHVYTWGSSDRYQTGLGTTDPATEPVMLEGEDIDTTFVKVDAGRAWSVFAARPEDAE